MYTLTLGVMVGGTQIREEVHKQLVTSGLQKINLYHTDAFRDYELPMGSCYREFRAFRRFLNKKFGTLNPANYVREIKFSINVPVGHNCGTIGFEDVMCGKNCAGQIIIVSKGGQVEIDLDIFNPVYYGELVDRFAHHVLPFISAAKITKMAEEIQVALRTHHDPMTGSRKAGKIEAEAHILISMLLCQKQ